MPPDGGDWQRVFYDDFQSLDGAIWEVVDGSIDALGPASPANATITADGLRLSATSGPTYAGARIRSRQYWMFGWYESRMRWPVAAGGNLDGLWGTFWMLTEGYPSSGQEFDIGEQRGSFPDQTFFNHLWQHTPAKLENALDVMVSPFDGEWHTWAAEWDLSGVTFYIDGTAYHTCTNVPSRRRMGLQLDCRTSHIIWAGEPSGTSQYPMALDVDYVGVWQKLEGWRGYQRVAYTAGLTGQKQSDYLTSIRNVSHTSGLQPQYTSHPRVIGAQDILVEYACGSALSAADWANAIYQQLGIAEATVLSNLTVTTYAGDTWEARRLACKAALSL